MPGQNAKRIDTASRIIKASPRRIYEAYVDPGALASWLPPTGMTGHVDTFEPRVGGAYVMTLTYVDPAHSAAGKSTEGADVVRGCFVELLANERIVQTVEFESNDPGFAGVMKLTWSLNAVAEGTLVAVICENVPEGIRREDHEAGWNSTLANLAAFVE